MGLFSGEKGLWSVAEGALERSGRGSSPPEAALGGGLSGRWWVDFFCGGFA
jgi:hypothetical protein